MRPLVSGWVFRTVSGTDPEAETEGELPRNDGHLEEKFQEPRRGGAGGRRWRKPTGGSGEETEGEVGEKSGEGQMMDS